MGSGCPAAVEVSCHDPSWAVSVAKQAVQNRLRLEWSTASFSQAMTSPASTPWRAAAPDGVASDAGQRGGIGSGAARVADDERPPVVVDGEHVVEVAADGVGSGRPVAGRDVDAWNCRQGRWQQRLLECHGDVALLISEPRRVERLGEPTGCRLGEGDDRLRRSGVLTRR